MAAPEYPHLFSSGRIGTMELRNRIISCPMGDRLANDDGSLEVLTDPLDFETVRARLMADGFAPAAAEITQRAASSAQLEGAAAESMARLLDLLENLDDVQSVYSNAEIPDEVLARL